MKQGQTLRDIMREREPLYEKYAHLTIDVQQLDIKGVVREIVNAIHREKHA